MNKMISEKPKAVVFLAEDDLDDQLLFKEGFKACCDQTDLLVFGDGFELMEHLHQQGQQSGDLLPQQRKIIFLDLNMPRKSGITVLKELKAAGNDNTAVVVWTTTDDPDTISQCYQLGADLFITKPLSFEDITANIREVMKRFL